MITLTEAAVSQTKQIIDEQNINIDEIAIRLRIVGNGCQGFESKLDLDADFNERDEIFHQDGLKIVVDKRSILYVEGSIIDFDIDRKGYKVINPNNTKTCGCNSARSTDH